MKEIETEIWGQPVVVEYEINGRHRPERLHDMGWDQAEKPEVELYAVLIRHPTLSRRLDLLPILGDDEREKIEIEIERVEDGLD
jgi:hypothetical protein